METLEIGDIVVLTNDYMRDWCPDERLQTEFSETTRPLCDIGVVLSRGGHPDNEELIIYQVYWFPANKVYSDHGRRLRLISTL